MNLVAVELLLESTLLLGVAAALAGLLRHRAALVRHLIWVLAFAVIAVVSVVPRQLAPWSWTILPQLPAPAVAPAAAVEENRAAAISEPSTSGQMVPSAVIGNWDRAPTRRNRVWPTWLAVFYLTGVALCLSRLAVGLAQARRLRSRGRPPRSFCRWSRELATIGGAPPVALGFSSALRVPVTFGWRRPALLLPEGAELWPRPLRRQVLLHELGHIERGDWLVGIGVWLVASLYWFHPLVWWARRRLLAEAEAACDDRVLLAGADPTDYAKRLLSFAQRPASSSPALAAMARGPEIARRIEAILQTRTRRSVMTRSQILAASLAATFMIVVLSSVQLAGAATAYEETAEQAEGLPAEMLRELVGPAPLHRSVLERDTAALQRAIADTEDLDVVAEPLGTALIVAAAVGDEAAVEILLEAGAAVDARGARRPHQAVERSALVTAARYGRVAIAEILLEGGAEVDATARGDATALIEASRHGHLEMAQLLLAAGADPGQEVPGDGSPMIAAAGSGSHEIVELLLGHGAAAEQWVDGDESPLFQAVQRGDTDVVRRLLDAGADANARWPGDGSPLIVAAGRGNVDTVRLLLDRGADPNLFVSGDGTALIVAASGGHEEVVELLLARGADPDLGVRGDGSPLIGAARHGYVDITRLLADRGADIELVVPGDENALIQAAGAGRYEVAELLLDRGADPNVEVVVRGSWLPGGSEVRSALRMAEQGGHDEVVELLRSRGAVH